MDCQDQQILLSKSLLGYHVSWDYTRGLEKLQLILFLPLHNGKIRESDFILKHRILAPQIFHAGKKILDIPIRKLKLFEKRQLWLQASIVKI